MEKKGAVGAPKAPTTHAGKPTMAPTTRHLLQELRQTKRRGSAGGSFAECPANGSGQQQHSRNSSKPSNAQSGVAIHQSRTQTHVGNFQVPMKSLSQIEQISAKSTQLLQGGGQDLPIRFQRARYALLK